MSQKSGFLVYVNRVVFHPLNRHNAIETGPHLVGAFRCLTSSEADELANFIAHDSLGGSSPTDYTVTMKSASDFEIDLAIIDLGRPEGFQSPDLVALVSRCAALRQKLDQNFASPRLVRLRSDGLDRFFDPSGLPVYFAETRVEEDCGEWIWDVEPALYRQDSDCWVLIDHYTSIDKAISNFSKLRGVLSARQATEWLLHNRIRPPAELDPYLAEFMVVFDTYLSDARPSRGGHGGRKLLPRPPGTRPKRANGNERDQPWIEWERAIYTFVSGNSSGVQACWNRFSAALVTEAGVTGLFEFEAIHARGRHHDRKSQTQKKPAKSPAGKI